MATNEQLIGLIKAGGSRQSAQAVYGTNQEGKRAAYILPDGTRPGGFSPDPDGVNINGGYVARMVYQARLPSDPSPYGNSRVGAWMSTIWEPATVEPEAKASHFSFYVLAKGFCGHRDFPQEVSAVVGKAQTAAGVTHGKTETSIFVAEHELGYADDQVTGFGLMTEEGDALDIESGGPILDEGATPLPANGKLVVQQQVLAFRGPDIGWDRDPDEDDDTPVSPDEEGSVPEPRDVYFGYGTAFNNAGPTPGFAAAIVKARKAELGGSPWHHGFYVKKTGVGAYAFRYQKHWGVQAPGFDPEDGSGARPMAYMGVGTDLPAAPVHVKGPVPIEQRIEYAGEGGAPYTLGKLSFHGRTSFGVEPAAMAEWQVDVADPTHGAENAVVTLRNRYGGNLTERLKIGQGIYDPSAAGGDKGNGSLNFRAVYMDGKLALGVDTTAPATPTGLAAGTQVVRTSAAGTQQIVVPWSWDANTEADLNGYVVALKRDDGGFRTFKVEEASFECLANAGEVLQLKVLANDTQHNVSPFCDPVSCTVAGDTAVPGPVSVTLAASARPKGVVMKMTAPDDKNFGGVVIYVNTVGNPATAAVLDFVPGRRGKPIKYRDDDPHTVGDTLHYWAAAVNQDLVESATRTSLGSVTYQGVKAGDLERGAVTPSKLAAPTDANLLPDPGYMDVADSWQLGAGMARRTSADGAPWSGICTSLAADAVLGMTGNGTTSQPNVDTYCSQYIRAEPGKKYLVTCPMAWSAGTTAIGFVTVHCYDKDLAQIGDDLGVASLADGRSVALAGAGTETRRYHVKTRSVAGGDARDTAFIRIRVVPNWSTTLANAGAWAFGQIRVVRTVELGSAAHLVDSAGNALTDGAVITAQGDAKGALVDNSAPSTNSNPSVYRALGLVTRRELKQASAIGATGSADANGVLETHVPSASTSVAIKQRFIAEDGTWKRKSTSETAWSGWKKLYDEDNKPSFAGDVTGTADWSTQVAGTGKPADNATVGAVLGTNLKASSGATVGDNDALNSKAHDSRGYNRNPTFQRWTGTAPDNWTPVGSLAVTKQTASPRYGDWAMEVAYPASDNQYLLTSTAEVRVPPSADDYHVIEYEVELVAGDFSRAGIWWRVNYQDTSNYKHFSLDLSAEHPGAVTGKVYAGAKVVSAALTGAPTGLPSAAVLHLMGNHALMGDSVSAKTLRWHRVSVRKATREEIRTATLGSLAAKNSIGATDIDSAAVNTGHMAFDSITKPDFVSVSAALAAGGSAGDVAMTATGGAVRFCNFDITGSASNGSSGLILAAGQIDADNSAPGEAYVGVFVDDAAAFADFSDFKSRALFWQHVYIGQNQSAPFSMSVFRAIASGGGAARNLSLRGIKIAGGVTLKGVSTLTFINFKR